MNKLIYVLFISFFFLDYLATNLGLLPRVVTWVPELISLAAALVVVVRLVTNKQIALQLKYVMLFFCLFLVIVAGIGASTVQPGAIFAAIRTYLKDIPIFLLPAVYNFSDREIKRLINILLYLAILQFPVTLFQRFVQYRYARTGDVISGTLGVNASGILTIFLLSCTTILFAYFLKGKISRVKFIFVAACLLIPTIINETTITLILLPIVFLVPALFNGGSKGRVRNLLVTLGFSGVALVAFVVIYDQMYGGRWGGSVTNLFTEGAVAYEFRQRSDKSDSKKEIGRVTSITMPITTLSKDPVMLLIGVGAGNASTSFSKFLEGEFAKEYEELGAKANTLSIFLWELGLLGTTLFLVFFYLVFTDVRKLKQRPDYVGALALGWVGVLVIVLVATVYFNIISANLIGYLFAFFSGYFAAKPVWLAKEYQQNHTVHSNDVNRFSVKKTPT